MIANDVQLPTMQQKSSKKTAKDGSDGKIWTNIPSVIFNSSFAIYCD